MMRGGGGGLIYHHAPFHEAQSLSQNVNTAKARASFTFRPTPSRRLFFISKSHIVPRPRAEGGAGEETNLRLRARIWLVVIASPRHVSFVIARSTARNRLAGYPCRSVKLIAYPIREARRPQRRHLIRRRFRHPPGLRSYVSLLVRSIRQAGR